MKIGTNGTSITKEKILKNNNKKLPSQSISVSFYYPIILSEAT